jgi:hypothetical protein
MWYSKTVLQGVVSLSEKQHLIQIGPYAEGIQVVMPEAVAELNKLNKFHESPPAGGLNGDTTVKSKNVMDTILAISLGIGLSAASGFRLFVPMLGLSIAVMTGYLEPAEGFAWIGSWPALIAFGGGHPVLEIGVYYIPWLDNVDGHPGYTGGLRGRLGTCCLRVG